LTTSYFSGKPSSYYYTYDTSKSEIENLNSGYVDTFSVAGIKFQLFANPDTLGDLELQVMKNGKWQTNLRLGYGINGNEATTDINHDGFNDFTTSLLRGNHVYLFDSTQKEFHQEPIYVAFEWSVIDASKNFYSNNYSNRDYWHTSLFTLKGLKQTTIYNAVIDVQIDTISETGNLRLYKVNNNHFEDTVLIITKKIDLLNGDFDYRKYWTDFLKTKGYR
jgi:hypothetical protein